MGACLLSFKAFWFIFLNSIWVSKFFFGGEGGDTVGDKLAVWDIQGTHRGCDSCDTRELEVPQPFSHLPVTD